MSSAGGLELCIRSGGTIKIRLHPAASGHRNALCPSRPDSVCTVHWPIFVVQFQFSANIDMWTMRNLKGMCVHADPTITEDKPHSPSWLRRVIYYPGYSETMDGSYI